MKTRVLALLVIVTCAAGCAAEAQRPVRLSGDAEFTLSPGQQAEVVGLGRNMTVRLLDVATWPCSELDSPCPVGLASTKVLVQLEVPGETNKTVVLAVADQHRAQKPDFAPCLPIGEHRIRVDAITPPHESLSADEEYRVTFDVAERCDQIPLSAKEATTP